MPGNSEGSRLIIDENNRVALVVIVTAVGISWTTLALIIRVVSKLHVKKTIGVEEVLVIIASAFAFATSSCVLVAAKNGFGRNKDQLNVRLVDVALKALWSSDIFYVITMAVAKCAALPLLAQLTPLRKFIRACYCLAIFIGCWGFASVLLIGTRCRIQSPWDDMSSAKCPSLFGRWVAVESISILIEALVFGLFCSIIYILKMSLAAKVKVVIAFSTRLSTVIPIIFRLVYLKTGLEAADNPTLALTNSVIAAQAVLHYTTMAASFAYIRPFLRAFDSNLGATVKVDTVVSTGYISHSEADDPDITERKQTRQASYAMTHVRSSKPSNAHDTVFVRPRTVTVADSKAVKVPRSSKRLRDMELPRYLVGQNGLSQGKQGCGASIAPVIMKTQEWHVHTEHEEPGPSVCQVSSRTETKSRNKSVV